MSAKTILTGIKPTGNPHLGNLVGAIRPALTMASRTEKNCFFFVADYHALTTIHDPKELQQLTREVTATWLAFGLDPEKSLLYRQSDIPEDFELAWILSCFAGKGLLNRAHAYKAKVTENVDKGKKDPDAGIHVGLFTYPVLMAADILIFDADEVPVGEDQIQHIEIARDIAQKFNHTYGETLRLPKAVVQPVPVIPGLDGQKMSKSYGNTIPLFEDSKRLRKLVMKIQTDSTPPEAPKDPDTSSLFTLYQQFASEADVAAMRKEFEKGIGWGHVKQALYEQLEKSLEEPRKVYEHWMKDPKALDNTLKKGAEKAREISSKVLKRVRVATGINA